MKVAPVAAFFMPGAGFRRWWLSKYLSHINGFYRNLTQLSHPISHPSHPIMTVSAILKGRKDQLGRQTIFIRIADGNKRTFKSTKLKVLPADWNGKVKTSHPYSESLNLKIRQAIYNIENNVNPEHSDADFKEYVVSCLNEWDKTKKYSTIRQLTAELSKFSKFKPGTKLSQITPDLLKKYEAHCFGLGNSQSTVWKSMKFLKLITNKAVKERVIKDSPFLFYKAPRYQEAKRTFLSRDEINTIEEKIPSMVYELKFVATWFLICCYTGLRISDIQVFDKKRIKDGRLILYTTKTGEPVSIKLNEKVSDLLKSIKYERMKYTQIHYNRLLRIVGQFCDIEEHLTSHVARHSFAMLCADAGLSMEVTGRLLGHSSLKTTATYFKLTNPRVDSELEKIFLK